MNRFTDIIRIALALKGLQRGMVLLTISCIYLFIYLKISKVLVNIGLDCLRFHAFRIRRACQEYSKRTLLWDRLLVCLPCPCMPSALVYFFFRTISFCPLYPCHQLLSTFHLPYHSSFPPSTFHTTAPFHLSPSLPQLLSTFYLFLSTSHLPYSTFHLPYHSSFPPTTFHTTAPFHLPPPIP
jgi:hypothetical protein